MMDPENIAKMAHEVCLKHFKLSKTEWTVMACVFHQVEEAWNPIVVTTGVKCLPDHLCTADTVHDSHAEVLARRAIKHMWLGGYDLSGELCLYISQAPCGEASLEHLLGNEEHEGSIKRSNGHIVRGHEELHRRGVLRTKPGRGDAPYSSSWSCSDKLMLWNELGLLGRHRGPKLCFSHLVIGERYDQASMKRIFERVESDAPGISHSETPFPWACSEQRTKPASVAQIWTCDGLHETLVQGRKQGSRLLSDGSVPLKARSALCPTALRRDEVCSAYAKAKSDLLSKLLIE